MTNLAGVYLNCIPRDRGRIFRERNCRLWGQGRGYTLSFNGTCLNCNSAPACRILAFPSPEAQVYTDDAARVCRD